MRERHEVDLYDMWEPLPVRCNQACVFFSACAHGRRVVTGSPNRNQTRYSQTSKTTSKHTDTHIKHRGYHFCIHKCSCKLKPQLRLWCNFYARERAANKREEKWVCVFVNVLQFVLLKRGQRPGLCRMTGILSARLRCLCDLCGNNAMEFPSAICVCMCELGLCWGNCMSICIDKCSYGRERSRCDCQSMTHACANVAHPRWKGFYAAAFSSGEQLTNYTHNIHLLLPKLKREIDRQWELV